MFQEYLITFYWGITGAITMGVSLAILLGVFTILTPKLKEWEELKKGNVAVGIVVGSVLIAAGIVIAACINIPASAMQ